ncbi:MAG: hypothetical protein R6X02_10830, partial [Enhygromyxa sp.]
SQQMGGKTYFAMWSLDVRAEDANLCRHTDIATSNHGSNANTPPQSALDQADTSKPAEAGDEDPACECCGQRPMHDGQLGPDGKPGPVVSEEEWYMIGPEEDVGLEKRLQELCDTEPNRQHKKGGKHFEAALDDLAERERKLVERRKAIARGKAAGCKSFPEPPCNVYRVLPPGASESIGGEWKRYRKKYLRKKGFPDGSRTNHRVPKAAGGCPGNEKSEGNLVHDLELGPECAGFDSEVLTPIHDDCAKAWEAKIKAGWRPAHGR